MLDHSFVLVTMDKYTEKIAKWNKTKTIYCLVKIEFVTFNTSTYQF